MPKKKVAKVKQEEKEEVFYVGIKDPIEIRRSVLESSKDIIQYLQRFERFKQVREEKAHEIKKLKDTMHELHSLVRKVKSKLPKTSLRSQYHKHEEEVAIMVALEEAKKKELAKAKASEKKKAAKEKKEESVEEFIEKPVEREPKTELEKLEAELSEIEGRLTNLV